jgi:hypothetical protein
LMFILFFHPFPCKSWELHFFCGFFLIHHLLPCRSWGVLVILCVVLVVLLLEPNSSNVHHIFILFFARAWSSLQCSWWLSLSSK